jgi:hypothetical protein
MRRIVRSLLLLVVALVSVGCYRSDLGITVGDDGSGRVQLTFTVDPARVRQLAGQLGPDAGTLASDPCATLLEQARTAIALPPGGTIEPTTDDGFCGFTVTASFASAADIGPFVMNDLTRGVPDADTGRVGSFVLAPDGDGWRFDANLSGSTTIDLSAFSSFVGDAHNIVRVRLPGHIVEENADRTEDDALVWDLNPLGDARTMSARSSASSGDGGGVSAALWVVLGLVVVAAAAGGALLVRHNRAKPAPTAPSRPEGNDETGEWKPRGG